MPRAKPAGIPSGHIHFTGKTQPAELADLDDLVQLESSFTSDQISRRSFRHLLTRGQADVLVFREDGRIVGDAVILYRRNLTRARIYSLVVHPRYQGRGIARALIQAAEDAAKNRACASISLEVRPDNEPALRLYKKLGYELLGRVENYYEGHTAALRLSKKITSPSVYK